MEMYVPDIYQKDIFSINYDKLKKDGIRLLLFDLDNTIAPFNKKEADISVKELFTELKSKGFIVSIFSNSPKLRCMRFAEDLEIEYVYGAMKPKPDKFLKTLKKYKVEVDEAAIIGDQLLTDIKGGNNVGIITIFLDPYSSYDPIWTRIARRKERRIKNRLRELGLFKGRYYDEKM